MFGKLIVSAALAVSLAAPLAALEMEAMSDAERAAFRAEVRAYLLENPEVLLEAIRILEERQAANQAAGDIDLIRLNADEIFNDGYSFVGGNPDGDVTMVEFIDYRCGFCKRAHPEVAELLRSDGNIRYIVKEFPILGEQSVLASRFALAVMQVEGDAAYYATNNTLMTMRSSVTQKALTEISDNSGYDTAAVFAAMDSEAITTSIDRNRALAQRLRINGTPSFVLNTRMLRGYAPPENMRQAVAQVRANQTPRATPNP